MDRVISGRRSTEQAHHRDDSDHRDDRGPEQALKATAVHNRLLESTDYSPAPKTRWTSRRPATSASMSSRVE
jgi:hypothetical protein